MEAELHPAIARFRKMDPPMMMPIKMKPTSKTLPGPQPIVQSQVEPTMKLFKSCSTNLLCAVCFGINARVCRGCHNIAYCSREHQAQHWSVHQHSCKPMVAFQKAEVLRNLSLPVEERGFDRFTGMYRAIRELKPKETVLNIHPIMHVAHNKGLPVPPDSILCLGCNRWYQLSQGNRCRKCKWPVCSEKCELDSCHSKFECRVFYENNIYPPPSTDQYNGDIVLALRCLMLKEVKPEDWEQLAEMEPIVESVKRSRICLEADQQIARFLFYKCHFNEAVGYTLASLMSFLKVIDYCSVWLPERTARMGDNQYSFISAKYVFPGKVFIAEECKPNCCWSLNHSPELEDCTIRLKASVVINPGDYLTVSFSGIAEYGASFSKRYENCRFIFKCKCSRCVDPTEGASFFSGVKCKSCTDNERGYVLPEDPSEYNGLWRCFNTECGKTENGTIVTSEVNKIHQELVENTSSFQGLITMLKSYEGVRLHPNHYLIMKATQLAIDLCWGICQNSALHVISITLLEKAKVLTEKLATIYKALYPWNSIQNAKLLFHYQMLHGIARIREILWYFEQDDKRSIKDELWYPNEFWDILDIQKSAMDVLIEEPLGSVERENGILMKGVLEDTESLLVLERRNTRIQYETLMGLQKVYARYCSGYLYSVMPVLEDKELNELLLFTGPYCKDLIDKTQILLL